MSPGKLFLVYPVGAHKALNFMPLNHAYGLRRYQSDMVNGGTVCLMDGMVFVGTLWKLMEKYQASAMALSPASLGMIFKLSGDRIAEYEKQLDYIQIGSAPLITAGNLTRLNINTVTASTVSVLSEVLQIGLITTILHQ